MQNKLAQDWFSLPNYFKYLIIVLLVIGVFFRVTNLDTKLYWGDEVYTSVKSSGYTETEVIQQALNGQVITIQDLQKFQRPQPERTAIDTIKGLIEEDPQHPPLYYATAQLWTAFWGQWINNSIALARSYSVLFSLFIFPAVYWLCLELFGTSLTAWIAVALVAVSPFHVLYSQVAREYSLWTLMIVLSSAALIRAAKRATKWDWGMYAITFALSLYTYPFSLFVGLGHGIYALGCDRFRPGNLTKNYLIAFSAAALAYAPWAFIILLKLRVIKQTMNWTSYSLKFGIPELVLTWFRSITRVFLDFELNYNFGIQNLFPYIIPILIIVVLAGYSIYFLIRTTPKQIWLFLVTFTGVAALVLILPDLILGGRRSSITRYLIPSFVGLQISIAYLFATKIVPVNLKIWQHKVWKLGLALLITGGILSCLNSYQATVWWNNGPSKVGSNPGVARVINQVDRPLVVSDANLGDVIALSYLLDPKVRLQVQSTCYLCSTKFAWAKQPTLEISTEFKEVFAYKPSKKLKAYFEVDQGYQLKPVYPEKNAWLWQLEK